ncbi:hypothetical protein [Caulobacter hibisci]|uniref:hypothetical protein n=1 Tax=Caulobacter hibisci TaxID=2035993 RepID=UPI001E4B5CE0|nr:hypothetical protein [Caulobacter hibisci]
MEARVLRVVSAKIGSSRAAAAAASGSAGSLEAGGVGRSGRIAAADRSMLCLSGR